MNEQDKATYERVREQVAKNIHEMGYLTYVSVWETLSEMLKEMYLAQADQILHLPGVAVLADDQTIPIEPEDLSSQEHYGWSVARNQFTGYGWKRTVKRD